LEASPGTWQSFINVWKNKKSIFPVFGTALIGLLDSGPGEQNWPKKKKSEAIHVLKCWMFSFDG
jgi:hypothetical protein